MNAETGELLSAFVDGEAVDPDRLAAALADPAAADVLVTCARIRAEIREDRRRPSPPFYARMERALRPRGLRRLWGRSGASVPWPMAAALAVVMLVAGAVARPFVLPPAGGPTPGRTVLTAPAAGTAGGGGEVAVAPRGGGARHAEAGVPEPTRRLQFTAPGEWREGV